MLMQHRWLLALVVSLVGFLLIFDQMYISEDAWAFLVLAGAAVLWYDYFSFLLRLRHETKMAKQWKEEWVMGQPESPLVMNHPLETEIAKEAERQAELKDTLSAAEQQIIDEALKHEGWDGK